MFYSLTQEDMRVIAGFVLAAVIVATVSYTIGNMLPPMISPAI